MRQHKLATKLYYRDIALVSITVIFYIYLNLHHFECAKEITGYLVMGDLSMLKVTMSTSIWCFTFFSFASYYYLDKLCFDSLEECAQSLCNGAKKIYFNQIFVLFVLAFIITLTLTAYNIYAYWKLEIHHIEVLKHMLYCILLYILGVSLAGIGLGLLVALKLKRLSACSLIALVVFISTPIFLRFVEILYYSFDLNVFPLYEFIYIFPRGLTTMPQHSVGYSLLPDRIAVMLFWLSSLYLISFLHIFVREKTNQIIMTFVGIAICCASLFVYLAPGTKTLTANNPKGDFAIDRMYYLFGYTPKEEPASFEITSYDMELTINDQLEAEVVAEIDTPDLEIYHFTLYHGYKVSEIRNQEGNKLTYEQNGDYIEVLRGANRITSLIFTYVGFNPTYYSYSQGILLPGHFAFYPRCGYQEIYDTKEQGFYNCLLQKPVNFSVKVNYQKEVYCNLSKIGKNYFAGVSDGCTILAGFLTSKTIENVEVVFPYLDTEQFGHGFLESDLRKFFEIKSDDNVVNKIMILPYVNMGTHARCNYYEDGTIVCVQIRTLGNDYFRKQSG